MYTEIEEKAVCNVEFLKNSKLVRIDWERGNTPESADNQISGSLWSSFLSLLVQLHDDPSRNHEPNQSCLRTYHTYL